jgi:Ferritin-like domain
MRETSATAASSGQRASRAAFLGKSALAGGALAAGVLWLGGRVGRAASAPSRAQDERILNFALGLEYLQAGFYAHAVERGTLSGELLEFAETVGEQERRHVEYLRRRLGPAARAEPQFDFGDLAADADRFGQAASVLEENGVAAYIGQGANLTVRAVAAAAPIVAVEARHAAWISDLIGRMPAPRAADAARTAAEVQARLEKAGFPYQG